jgi:hypothetical protein
VFTARYAPSPYIKQILFVFKRLDEEGDGWQRLWRAQILRSHMADYFLMLAIPVSSHRTYVSQMHWIIMQCGSDFNANLY